MNTLFEIAPPPSHFAGRNVGWSTLSSEGLWHAWRPHHTNDALAASAALWAANLLVKSKLRSTRRAFYEVKADEIRVLLLSGEPQGRDCVVGASASRSRRACHCSRR